jgi:hypothetical protein
MWRNWWNEDWQGKPKYSEKICPSATLCTTNPTWLDPGFNPGCRGGKPATNRLSYGAAHFMPRLLAFHLRYIDTSRMYGTIRQMVAISGSFNYVPVSSRITAKDNFISCALTWILSSHNYVLFCCTYIQLRNQPVYEIISITGFPKKIT